MDRITSKTKILLWGIVGEKEKIDFDLCDFSPDQVGDLDRLVREDDAKVRLTIEPEQKKLQIAPITSEVRLVSLSCRTKGQKLKIADFRSPDERATAIKRMCAADTPILLCIEEIQGQLFGSKKTTKGTKIDVGGLKADSEQEEIPLKFTGLRGCKGKITLLHDELGWRASYEIRVGNLEERTSPEDMAHGSSRVEALQEARNGLTMWAEEVRPTGNADAKRSMARRLADVCKQLDEQLDPLLNAAEEEFAEDDPEDTTNTDADEDEIS